MEHDPNLTIPPLLWQELLSELHRRTEEHHESGAFLLGHTNEHVRWVEQVVYYDDIDPHAYRTGVGSDACGKLRDALGSVQVKQLVGCCRYPCPSKKGIPESRRQTKSHDCGARPLSAHRAKFCAPSGRAEESRFL